MDLQLQVSTLERLGSVVADALVLIVCGQRVAAALDPRLAGIVNDAIKRGDFEYKKGRTLYVHRPQGVKVSRLVVVAAVDTTHKGFKTAIAAGLGQLKTLGVKRVAVAATSKLKAGHAEVLVTAAHDSIYIYRNTKPSAAPARVIDRLVLLCSKNEAADLQLGLARGQAIAHGVELARELANLPGNHCTPSFLAAQASKLAKTFRLRVEVLERKALEKLGMGAFLAVAQGSAEPMKLIVLRYDGAARSEAPVVLVGKGITFDSGGVSIKPSAEMDEMKFDMCGAASVLGTLRAVAELRPKLNLVCVVPTCENMPGGRAVKPGDVVTSMSGQTIEILNTDAEGRLILCDALTYTERLKPALVVDVATLTGACVVALGHHHSGLFTSDNALATQMQTAAENALDPCWRMPLDEEYDDALKSNFADMGNVGQRAGGAVTAAMFLRRFTGKYRWAHLDIAGTAWKSGIAKGATGRPVPLLTHFLLAQTDSA